MQHVYHVECLHRRLQLLVELLELDVYRHANPVQPVVANAVFVAVRLQLGHLRTPCHS